MHLSLEFAVKIVDEHLVLPPGKLENFIVEDTQALAEHGGAKISQWLHLSVERNQVQPVCPADTSGALVESITVNLKPLGEADLAARDLGDDIETKRRGFVANLRTVLLSNP